MKHKFLREKRNRFKIIVIFALLLLAVGYACREEFEDSYWERTEAPKLIDDAKTWYESNKPQTMGLRSSNGEQFMMKAEWTNAFATQSENYTIVETNLMSKGRLLYVDDSCKVKYEETNDPKYMQCYTRIVFRTDRETNETVGFLMTVVPNLEWLEKSNFKPFRDVTYLYRSKNFGGMLLFHEMDGRFSNGWTYKDGKVVASIGSMDADSSQIALRSTVCDIVGVPNYQTDCVGFSTVNEDGSYNDFLTCSPVLVGYTYSSYCYDDGTGSGSNNNSDPPGYTDGSGGGGSGNPTNTTNPNDPCSVGATGNTSNNNMVANSTVKTQMDDVLKSKVGSTNEWAVSVGRGSDGTYYVSNAEEQGAVNGTLPTVPNGSFYASGHSHGKDTGVPSPGDLYSFFQLILINPSMQTMYVYGVGWNGSIETYAINVNNRDNAIAFLNVYPMSTNFNSATQDFMDGSAIGDAYKLIQDQYNSSNGYISDNADYAYMQDAVALAYIMNQFGMGVTLSRRIDNGNFSTISVTNKSSTDKTLDIITCN